MAVISISQDDVIDVEFETVSSGDKALEAHFPRHKPRGPLSEVPGQLSLLRDQFADPYTSSQPDEFSPTFLVITLICAFVVFWVSGGHALLY